MNEWSELCVCVGVCGGGGGGRKEGRKEAEAAAEAAAAGQFLSVLGPNLSSKRKGSSYCDL